MHHSMLLIAFFATSWLAMPAVAQLPPPTPQEKAEAAEIAARNAWEDKIGAYQLCRTTDRIAAKYRATRPDSPSATIATPPCTDPGPYLHAAPGSESKPLEAAESHSPAGTMVGPNNTRENEKETQSGQGE